MIYLPPREYGDEPHRERTGTFNDALANSATSRYWAISRPRQHSLSDNNPMEAPRQSYPALDPFLQAHRLLPTPGATE